MLYPSIVKRYLHWTRTKIGIPNWVDQFPSVSMPIRLLNSGSMPIHLWCGWAFDSKLRLISLFYFGLICSDTVWPTCFYNFLKMMITPPPLLLNSLKHTQENALICVGTLGKIYVGRMFLYLSRFRQKIQYDHGFTAAQAKDNCVFFVWNTTTALQLVNYQSHLQATVCLRLPLLCCLLFSIYKAVFNPPQRRKKHGYDCLF